MGKRSGYSRVNVIPRIHSEVESSVENTRGRQGRKGRAQRICRAVEALCDSTVMDTCPHTSVETHRMYSIHSEP